MIRLWWRKFAERQPRASRAKCRRSQSCRPQIEVLEDRQLLSGTTPHLQQGYGQQPLSFEPNQGQTAAPVQFLSRGPGYSLFLTPAEAVLRLQKTAPPTRGQPPAAPAAADILSMQLVGANATPPVVGLDRLAGVSNYLIGNDPSRWHTNVPLYGQVEYQNVYPGIDLVYYGHQGQLEYDFVLAPGADPGVIQLAFQGERGLSLDGQGDLVLHTAGGDLIEHAPDLYQQVGGARHAVAGQFVLEGGGRVGFAVGAYDPTQRLTIDPTLLWSTYLGGSGDDHAWGIAVNQYGQAYVTGDTGSTDFPTLNAIQTTGDSNYYDAFVAKFSTGGALLWATYFGGSTDSDGGSGIAVNQYGQAYVTGDTYSTDFPTKNAFQARSGGASDAFVAKFSTGGSLLWSTYLGGGDFESGYGIAVDHYGHAYVTGTTCSSDFPTRNAFQAAFGGSSDAFVAKFSTGGALLWSTYLGGSDYDEGDGIAANQYGQAYVTGLTYSSDFPTRNAFQATFGGGYSDAFVAKFSAGGSRLWSTYLGGDGPDYGYGIAVDPYGHAYVTGFAGSTNFPTLNAFQTAGDGGDAFVAKFSTGGVLLWSTYLGGIRSNLGQAIAVDQYGNAYVTGYTYSTDFPTLNAFQTANSGNGDAFVTKFSTGGSLLYSSYLGGSGYDVGDGIAVDPYGHAYVTGTTDSSDFPTANPFQAHYAGGGGDAFVAKIS
jgi:hypothetical protein